MLGTRSKTIILTLDPEIKSTFQKLKGEASRAKKQLFKEGSSLSSSIDATEIDLLMMSILNSYYFPSLCEEVQLIDSTHTHSIR